MPTSATSARSASRGDAGSATTTTPTTDGGKTFNDAPSTPVGKTRLANLPPLTMIGFRVKATTSMSPGEWSPIVSILVH